MYVTIVREKSLKIQCAHIWALNGTPVNGAGIPRPYTVGDKVTQSYADGSEVPWPYAGSIEVPLLAVGAKGLALPQFCAGGKEVPPRAVYVVCKGYRGLAQAAFQTLIG